MSLLLSNVPMSPKLINGSFAALFDNNDVIVEYAKRITNSDFNGRPIRLSPRRRIRLRDQPKQMSLDCSTQSSKNVLSKYKQSSLDSKIEEILERSGEVEELQHTEEESETETEVKEINAQIQHHGKLQISNRECNDGSDVTHIQNGHLNLPYVCKYCGKPNEDP